MKHSLIMLRNIILFIILMTTSSCYWHIRNPDDVPPQLRVLYLKPQNVESHFRNQLINTLRSVLIVLTPTPKQAPYILNVYDYSLIHDNPSIQSTTIAVTYTYTLTVTVSITDSRGNIVVPAHTIEATRAVTVNTNQIFTINSTSVFQQEMQREGVNLIYYWLTSAKTRRLLETPPPIRKINATQPPTTTITS
jgi:LPS-assembly lipoprotein